MNEKRKYITGIDGLRSIAVIGVIFYHLIPRAMPGGYLGVPLFFVISGYLMTDILLNEWKNRKKIGLKKFYYKRVRRIYPSLILMLVLSGSAFVFFTKDLLINFKQIVVSSLLNLNNFWQLFNGSSYFDRFGNESGFTHLWSLSIEGQFYLFWPIVIALLVFKKDDYKLLSRVIIGTTVFSGILMAVLYQPENVNRIYYGTDTRLFSILMGAYLAVYINDNHTKIEKIDDKWKILSFVFSSALIVLGLFFLKDNLSIVYYGGMFAFSAISALLLGTIISSDKVNDWLTNPLFKWIGTRSYEIYLWQFPVMIAYEKMIKWDGTNSWIHLLLQFALILLLSEITYRVVHIVIFDFKLRKDSFVELASDTKGKIVLGLVILILGTFAYAFALAPSGRTEASVALEKKLEENKKILEKQKNTTKSATSENKKTTESSTDKVDETVNQLTNKEKDYLKKLKFTAIGDSLLLSAAPQIQGVFPDNFIDADVGRQLMDSEPVFKKAEEDKKIGDVVLIVLGTNGSFSSSDIDNIMDKLGDKPVFFVDTMVQKPWQKAVNDELDKTAKRFKNAHVIDWKEYSTGKTNWFESDGVHLTPEGAENFANLVGKEIYKTLN